MTGLIILTFIPFLVAVGFLIRMRGERKARLHAERELRAIRFELDTHQHNQQEWNAALAHELRSPLAAVLGYGELLEEGAFGVVDERAADALRRIRFATQHLLQLIDGVERAALPHDERTIGTAAVSARALMLDAVDALQFDAEARHTTIHVLPGDLTFITPPDDAARALALALGAAIKASPGATLTLTAGLDPEPAIRIQGTRLHRDRDNPDNATTGADLSGPGFRLVLARHAARMAGGSLDIHPIGDLTTLVLCLPSEGGPVD